jgi:hypothetical protein
MDSVNRIKSYPMAEAVSNLNETFNMFLRELENPVKLINAYRAYTKELERYTPR